MTRLILIRHGYSVGNKERRFSGQADVPLDEIGVLQAKELSEYIVNNYKVDAVYSSDLSRAYETVRTIAEELSLSIIKSKALRELDVGIWQGRLVTDVAAEYPEECNLYMTNVGRGHPVGGESYEALMQRANAEILRIAKENEGKTVVVGTHGGVIRVIRARILGLTLDEIKNLPHVPNASITVLEYCEGDLTAVTEGYNGYLSQRTTESKLN